MLIGFNKFSYPSVTKKTVSREVKELPSVGLGTSKAFFYRDGTFMVPDGITRIRLSGTNYHTHDATLYNMIFDISVFPGEVLSVLVKGDPIGVKRGTELIAGLENGVVANGTAITAPSPQVSNVMSIIEW